MAKYILISSLFFGVTEKVAAQELPPIQTDRPDQTETPYTVPKNHFQMENGINYEKVNDNEVNMLHPTSLWKVGLNDIFELRLITEYSANRINDSGISPTFIRTAGLNPVKVGFKSNLCKEKGIIPLTSFIAHLSVPFLSSKQLASSYFAPSFRFTMQHTLSENVSLGYNLGAEWDGESAEPSFIYTLTTGFALTEKVGAYMEIYGFAPQTSPADHRADGGITYLISHNVLLDLSGGVGLTANAPDYYGSFGFSFRLPN
ncbi:MAG: transporter [Bacteroidota bacterium]|nr:transporter [Bacteroidota bacterium]